MATCVLLHCCMRTIDMLNLEALGHGPCFTEATSILSKNTCEQYELLDLITVSSIRNTHASLTWSASNKPCTLEDLRFAAGRT